MCAAARFVKSEVVLCVALLLAIISMFFVPPDAGYLDYIDWDTLALLFSLMAVMKGFQSAGVFSFLAGKLLKKANTSRKIMLVLVFLPFFLSMLVTNDVSLITFVPFGLIVLRSAKLERLAVRLPYCRRWRQTSAVCLRRWATLRTSIFTTLRECLSAGWCC